MLRVFFRLNLPYGIAKNDKGEWRAFNREYMPWGFNDMNYKSLSGCDYTEYPVYIKFNGLS